MSSRLSSLLGSLLAVLVVLLGTSGSASAVTRTWDNSTTDNKWSTAGNWSGDKVPGLEEDVSFVGLGTASLEQVNFDTDAVAASITFASGFDLGGSGSPVTFTSGKRLFINGNLTFSAGSVVSFDASNANRVTIDGNFNNASGSSVIQTAGKFVFSSNTSRTHVWGGAVFNELITTVPTGPVTTSLIGHWKIDEASQPFVNSGSGSSMSMTNDVGTVAEATILAPVLFTNTRSRYLNSAGDYLSISAVPAALQPADRIWTVSVWIRPTDATKDQDVVSASNDYAVGLNADGTARAEVRNAAAGWVQCRSLNKAQDGNWNHIVGINDGGSLTVYLNGARVDSSVTGACNYSGTALYDATPDPFMIGRNADTTNVDYHTVGYVDDVRWYGRVLTDDEVLQLLAGGPTTGTGAHTTTGAFAASTMTVESSTTMSVAERLVVGSTFTIAGTLTAAAGHVLYAPVIDLSGAGAFSVTGAGTVILTSGSTITPEVNSFSSLRLEQLSETNLVGYWKFDGANNAVALDYSGNARHGTLIASPSTDSSVSTRIKLYNPGALSLNGSSQYAVLPSTGMPDVDTSHAVSFWFYYTTAPSGAPATFVEMWNTASDAGYKIGFTSGGELKVHYDNGTDSGNMFPGLTDPSNAAWHHLVYVYNTTVGSDKHKLYIDGVNVDSTDATPSAFATANITVGQSLDNDVGTEYFAGKIDDLRIYNTYLTDAQVAALYAGGQSGKGGTGNHTLAAATVTGALSVDNGTLTIGAGNTAVTGNVTVNEGASLKLTAATSSLVVGNGSTVTMNGTLQSILGGSNRPSITSAGTYSFNVSTAPGRTAVLDLDGFAVTNTGNSGMYINNDGGAKTAATTFTSFKNINFSSTANGATSYLLQIKAGTLDQIFDNLTFNTTTTSHNVRLEDWDGGADTVKLLIGATCTGDTNCEENDSDGDNGSNATYLANDNIHTAAVDDAANLALISWVQRYQSEGTGTISGNPVAAFNWSSFAFRANYVLMNNASGTTDILYARDLDGDKLYTWQPPSTTDNFVGSPVWTAEADGFNYVYMIDDKGRVYKVKDTGAAFTQTAVWSGAGDFYRNGGAAGTNTTATSGLMVKGTALYWFGTESTMAYNRMFKLGFDKTAGTPQSLGNNSRVINTIPAIAYDTDRDWVFGASTNAVGAASSILKISTALDSTDNDVVSGGTVNGQVNILGGKVFVVDTRGILTVRKTATPDVDATGWAAYADSNTGRHNPACGTGTAHANCEIKNLYVDPRSLQVFFGDKDGHLYCVYNGAVCTGGGTYPFQPGSGDEFATAPIYRVGVVAIGAKNGNVYFVDRSAAKVFRKYALGAEVSNISYTTNPMVAGTGAYMIATTTGRVYFIPESQVPDPSSPR